MDDVKKMTGRHQTAFFYGICLLILILFHLQFDTAFGDIADTYGKVMQKGSEYYQTGGSAWGALWEFTLFHYRMWSSRNIIEAVMMILGILPKWIWRILDVSMILLLIHSMDKMVYIRDQKTKYLFGLLLLLSFPVSVLSTAGWDATTMNYTWVAATGMYAFHVILDLRTRKGSLLKWTTGMATFLYACNHEQFCLISLITVSAIIINDCLRRRPVRRLIPFWIINVVELAAILLCPGNRNRREVEIDSFQMGYFRGYSLPQKLWEGYCTLLNSFWGRGGVLLTILLLFVLLCVAIAYRKKAAEILVCVVMLIYTVGRALYCYAWESLPDTPLINVFRLPYRDSISDAVIASAFLFTILILSLIYTWSMKDKWVVWASLIGGAGSKIMLGLSVSFQVSGERTSTFFYVLKALFVLLLIQEHEQRLALFHKRTFRVIACVCVVCLFMLQYLSLDYPF